MLLNNISHETKIYDETGMNAEDVMELLHSCNKYELVKYIPNLDIDLSTDFNIQDPDLDIDEYNIFYSSEDILFVCGGIVEGTYVVFIYVTDSGFTNKSLVKVAEIQYTLSGYCCGHSDDGEYEEVHHVDSTVTDVIIEVLKNLKEKADIKSKEDKMSILENFVKSHNSK